MHTDQSRLVAQSLASTHHPDVFALRRPPRVPQPDVVAMLLEEWHGRPDSECPSSVRAARALSSDST